MLVRPLTEYVDLICGVKLLGFYFEIIVISGPRYFRYTVLMLHKNVLETLSISQFLSLPQHCGHNFPIPLTK